MSMYRKEWDCCGDVSETNGWEPEACPFCPAPPSPSTAPEVPPFPESFGLADVPHAMNTPDDWDADYRATWQKLQVAEINLSQMRAYARKLRAALDSRPAEVDDEGYQSVPTEITREMMRAIQTQSELGAYACSNLSGAYNLINELWRIALSAAPSHTTIKENG